MNRKILALLLVTLAGLVTPGMIYRPADMHLWDCWGYHHGDTWYLYILKSDRWGPWDGFNVSTSKDGVHWEYQGRGIDKSDSAVWQGTGYVWKSPEFEQDGRFFCNYSEQPAGEPQHICFGESSDLINWKRLDLTFHQDTTWYKKDGRWDCIYTIPRPGGGYYGYWTATPKGSVGFGFGETDDGIHWKALPPPEMDWGDYTVPGDIELGAVEKVGDRYYAIIGAWTHDGGMLTFSADKPGGPFIASEKNYSLLRGDCYFGRFFPTPDGLLVSHHLVTRIKRNERFQGMVNYFAPLKRARFDEEGTMRLGWWEGNNTLKGEESAVVLDFSGSGPEQIPAFANGMLDVRRGTVVEGTVYFEDLAEVNVPGIWLETEVGPCAAIRMLSSSETLGGVTGRDGSNFTDKGLSKLERWQHVQRDLPLLPEVSFRLLFRHSHIELYLDDYLFNVYSLPEPFTGRIGFMDGGAGIGKLKAWTMTLTEELPPTPSYFPEQDASP